MKLSNTSGVDFCAQFVCVRTRVSGLVEAAHLHHGLPGVRQGDAAVHGAFRGPRALKRLTGPGSECKAKPLDV